MNLLFLNPTRVLSLYVISSPNYVTCNFKAVKLAKIVTVCNIFYHWFLILYPDLKRRRLNLYCTMQG